MNNTSRIDAPARWLADRRVLVVSGAVWAVLASVLFAWPGRFSLAAVADACGLPAPDVAFAPSSAATQAFFAGCGESGLAAYRDLQVVDLFYPAALAIFLAAALALLLTRVMPGAAWLALVPIVASLGDYVENAAAWVLISVGPFQASWAASLLQAGSAVKVVFSWSAWLLVCGLLAATAVRGLRNRTGYAAPPAFRRR